MRWVETDNCSVLIWASWGESEDTEEYLVGGVDWGGAAVWTVDGVFGGGAGRAGLAGAADWLGGGG